ncbi:hypothetical protein ACQSSU_15180 [Micromonospora echinospora]
MLDVDDFWTLVEGSATVTGQPDERLGWLTDRLAELFPATGR